MPSVVFSPPVDGTEGTDGTSGVVESAGGVGDGLGVGVGDSGVVGVVGTLGLDPPPLPEPEEVPPPGWVPPPLVVGGCVPALFPGGVTLFGTSSSEESGAVVVGLSSVPLVGSSVSGAGVGT